MPVFQYCTNLRIYECGCTHLEIGKFNELSFCKEDSYIFCANEHFYIFHELAFVEIVNFDPVRFV